MEPIYKVSQVIDSISSYQVITRLEKLLYRFQDYVPTIMTLILIIVAFWGYRGSQVNKLGPPLGTSFGVDFHTLLRAARDVQDGNNPYAHALTFGESPDFEEFVSWDVAPFVYPPVVAVLAQPLLRLQPGLALNLWDATNLLLLIGSALILVLAFTNDSFMKRAVRFLFILVLFLVFYPIQADLKLGQMDILMLFLLSLTFLLYRIESDLAGLPLALALAIKPILVPMLLFFLWKRRWGLTAVAIITVGLLTFFAFWVIGLERLWDYITVNRLWANGPFLAFPINQAPKGFVLRMFANNGYIQPLAVMPWLVTIIPILVGLLAIVGWVSSIAPGNRRERAAEGVEYGLTLTSLMLFSPLTENIHFVWVLIPVAALLLATLDNLQQLENFLLFLTSFLITIYLGYPALLDRISSGWENLVYNGGLVESSKMFYTGLYLYGLIALNIVLIIYLKPKWLAIQRLKLSKPITSGEIGNQ